MGEPPVFVEGEPPDFSLLQRLLCLEPEPWRPLLTPPSPGGAAAAPGTRSLIGLQRQLLAGGTGSDTGTGTEIGTSARTGIDTGSGIGTSTGTGIDTGSGIGTSTGTRIGIGTSTGTGIGTSTGTGIDTGIGIATSTGIGTGTGTGTGAGRRRKAAHPQRGADPRDPSFRGVTLRMRLALPTGATGGCRLLVTARAHRIPTRSRSSSDDDAPTAKGHKRCASCKTLRTPLWRSAEDGTVLCNACGIRYRKYRVRCRRCWNIPGKSGTGQRPPCPRCPPRTEDATEAG